MTSDDVPDLTQGIALERLHDGGILLGKVGEDDAVLVRRGEELFAVGAKCSHYSGPLAKGLVTAVGLHCPLHHACFDLRTGAALRAPALDPIPCWRVERIGGLVFVREKIESHAAATSPEGSTTVPASSARAAAANPSSVVIIGGGGAGLSAVHTLREEGYAGRLTLISADQDAPCDRPNLSKDYLAGTASDDWIPLRSPDYYRERRIDLELRARVLSIDTAGRSVRLEGGATHAFDRLLLATGADPVKLSIPGAADARVHYLRTYADSRGLVEAAHGARRVVIVGGSFIGLEVAASLRERGLDVHVVALEKQPLERVMGAEIGRFVRTLHEAHGVVFHLGDSVARVEGREAVLESGTRLDHDLLVLGVGVRPSLALAEAAGLTLDRGVRVDEYLETTVPGIFAAGDIARWPDRRSGAPIRVEHWVVAERQGQTAARNMLGRRERFEAVPFFWTRQFGVSLKYVGHAESWDSIEIDGSVDAKDCALRYQKSGRTLALVTIGRDLESLKFEAESERATPA